MNDDTIVLENLRLRVEYARPGTTYTGSRFDWTGFVTQVTLDEKHTFLGDEGGGSGGRGLANEFGIQEPIGYEETAVGDQFPKLGVGLLTRTSTEPYRFSGSYPVQPFPMDVRADPTEVNIEVEPLPVNGYAARLFKTLRIRDNQLDIAYRLVNEGERPLRTTEYCHNFLRLDHQQLGTGYELCLPPGLALTDVPEPLVVEGDIVTWEDTPRKPFYCRTDAQHEAASWRLRLAGTGATIREHSDFPWQRFALWGTDRVVSPEVFIAIDLAAGEELTWTRRYSFNTAR